MPWVIIIVQGGREQRMENVQLIMENVQLMTLHGISLPMRLLAFLLVLLFTALFCDGATGNTLELPKQNVSVSSFKTEEIEVAGQKWCRILTDHYDITAFRL